MDFRYPWTFEGRRSATMATGGMVATSQPLAAQAGLGMLADGGNAADAAIATAAVLNVVEPHMTGIGGDAFALTHFDGEFAALNGSGAAPAEADLETYRERTTAETRAGNPAMPADGGMPVTVPGALDAWKRLLDRYGTRSLGEVLQPAIRYARHGFPVTETVASQWQRREDRLQQFSKSAATFLPDGTPPVVGQRFRNPELAGTLEQIAEEGVDAFYAGELGAAVVDTVRSNGGTLAMTDLEAHAGEWTTPISTTYRGVEVLEHPPNGQGAIALEALNIAEQFDLDADPRESERLHRLIEAMKLGFADGYQYLADPSVVDIPLDRMLSKDYAGVRAQEIGQQAATYGAKAGGDETVYLTVVDGDGNAVSFINSLYMGFGSALSAAGFAIHNRGHSFSLDPDDANALEPGKRPFHTIIPAMLREDGVFRASWGVMGGSMQPQGHLQVIAALVDSGLNPQAALDTPRFRWLEGRRVAIESTRLPDETVDDLRDRGHDLELEPSYFEDGGHFGGGQLIYRDDDGVLIGGSDPRRDGQAVGL